MTTWTDVDTIAKLLGVHRRTIQRWCREQRLPHHKIGRVIRFTPSDIAEIEAAYRVAPTEHVDVDILNPAYRERVVVVPMRRPA